MRILITITKGDMGGAQVTVLNTARELKNKGHFVTVGLGEGEFLKNELYKLNIPVHVFKSLKRSINPFKNIMFIFEIKKYLSNHNIDIVHFNSSNSLLGAIGVKLLKNKPKTIFTFHGLSTLDSQYGNSFTRAIYWIIFKFLLYFVDKNIFVSYDNLEKAKKMNLVSDGFVIYNGVNDKELNFIDKNILRKEIGREINKDLTNSYIIGSIGRLSWEKNYKFLIKILPRILEIEPNSICIIIGEGKEKERIENKIKKLKLNNRVFLLGEIENASKYLKLFDLFVLPSLYEGLSISLIETVFADIPAIASNVGGNKEILGEEFTYILNDEKDFINLFRKIYYKDKKQNFNNKKSLLKISKMIKGVERAYR